MKYKYYPFTICFEENTNCHFNLGQELELDVGDIFEKKFSENYPPIKYQVVSLNNFSGTITVREVNK